MKLADVDRFWNTYSRRFAPLSFVKRRETKLEPWETLCSSTDWYSWRPTPSRHDLTPWFDKLRAQHNLTLPPSFRLWYNAYATRNAETDVARLPCNPPDDSGVGLRQHLDPRSFADIPRELGLIPFADERNDAGPICFDPRAGGDPDRWPVVYWDHEYGLDPSGIFPLFSCFPAMLRAITAYLECDGDEEARLIALLDADPDGADDAAGDYWTGTGYIPED